MSLHLPTRRALQAAATTSLQPSTKALCSSMQFLSLANPVISASTRSAAAVSPQFSQSRSFFWQRKKAKQDTEDLAWAKQVEKKKREDDANTVRKKLTTAKLSDSIFSEELEGSEGDKDAADGAAPAGSKLHSGGLRTYEAIARSTDPDPRSRIRWQRKMVARMVRRRLDPMDKETRAERIARTERHHVSKGPLLHTSTKKLVHLAHQISGKTLDEAMVQMRFSKKKYAREIVHQLDLAKDEANVVAGMGLGEVTEKKDEGVDGAPFVPVTVKTKDGKYVKVEDPTRLYIEQAWVNRGPFTAPRYHYCGRGRSKLMWGRTSNLTVVVKEEKTRIREYQERVERAARRAPWVHLPNRPITAQRQYYSW